MLFLYIILVVYTLVRILLDTHSYAKTLAYIMLVFALPVAGVLFYFAFGINYRHLKLHKKLTEGAKDTQASFLRHVPDGTTALMKEHEEELGHFSELVRFIHRIGPESLSRNACRLLINGEAKFPEVLRSLGSARSFIHMEYYDWENDQRGNQIKEVLLRKMEEGVKVRVLYDDYASRKIRHTIVRELKRGGAEIYPVIKVVFGKAANRLNHRDHRKLIIIDGHTGFVGGINISDRYDNSIDTGLYWRDTHVKITGPAVLNMQLHFVVNWNACQPNRLPVNDELFPVSHEDGSGKELVQIISGGPIYPMSSIMLTYFRIFSLAKEKLYITNPYFIPNDSILDALKQAAISGVDVRLMVPERSDSVFVGAASRFYFKELLEAGVRIFLYRKGFVHAKTVVADGRLSVIGTANMDIRSFDLNFEIMSVIYGCGMATELESAFTDDLNECAEIMLDEWRSKGRLSDLAHAGARLASSFL